MYHPASAMARVICCAVSHYIAFNFMIFHDTLLLYYTLLYIIIIIIIIQQSYIRAHCFCFLEIEIQF